MMLFGVDISTYQRNVNYKLASQEVEFAIIRIGYGREENQKDDQFENHYKGFRECGVPVGIYEYSYAKDAAGAKKEAEMVLRWLGGRELELPIFYDLEENSVYQTGRQNVTEIAKTFCDAIKAKGYRAGVYANSNWWSNRLEKSDYDYVWCADWGTTQPTCDIWQFGGGTINYKRDRHVDGIGICDQNYMIRNIINEVAPQKPKDDKGDTFVVVMTTLQEGAQGREVKTLQILLNGLGFNCGSVDGIFGPKTKAGVMAAQKFYKIGVDGIAGPVTFNKLLKG